MEQGLRLKKPVYFLGKLGIWFLWAMLCALGMHTGNAQNVVALVLSMVLTSVRRRGWANAVMSCI